MERTRTKTGNTIQFVCSLLLLLGLVAALVLTFKAKKKTEA